MTKWDEKYRAGYGSNTAPEPLLVQAVHRIAPGIALDLACGRGRNAIYLAALGWQVTALDSSQVALAELPASIQAALTDLESPDFHLARDAYHLVCDCYYLHRPLFPQIHAAVKPGGLFVAVIPMDDDDPAIQPMNSAYLCRPGELQSIFSDWEIVHTGEGKPQGDASRRRIAELIARKPAGA
ncbi:MAG: methyltransferase domain-containing protein [Bryobacteraceae bacterium]